MLSLLARTGGRRGKLVALAVWLAIAGAAGPIGGGFEDAQQNDPASYLPDGSESVAALRAAERLPSGDVREAVVAYRRAGGLTGADRRAIERHRASLAVDPPPASRPPGPPLLAPDGAAALLVVPITPRGDNEVLTDATDRVRELTADVPAGLAVKVTGQAGFQTDALDVFDDLNATLLATTGTLVLLLLILIYRSPIFWLIPFLGVVVAELCSRAGGYLMAESGITVNSQSAGILAVLVFGAGTDYALLVVARYREELRRHEDRHEAVALAVARAGPAILASAGTVIAGLLCLTLAEVEGTAGLGPVGAMGIALAALSSLTLLPALLALAGRRAFWPFVPRLREAGAGEAHGPWRRLGERIAAAPWRASLASLAVLAVLAVGLTSLDSDLTPANQFRDEVESTEGQKLVAASFPAGANAPTTVIVRGPGRAEAVRAELERVPGVTSAVVAERGAGAARVDVTLKDDPYSRAAFDRVPDLRAAARSAGGDGVLVGGPTAEERDFRESAARDNRVIVPIALAVVLVILLALLRAVVAPLLLVATVVASFAAALGVGAVAFEQLLGYAGTGPAIPLLAFVFLVALGVDYNIFLMARVREETLERGAREGMLRGLAVTGGVITSAGIVLAGTFTMLVVLPLVALSEVGLVVAFGVLLDTFLVRSVLVPALVLGLGPRAWWPARVGP